MQRNAFSFCVPLFYFQSSPPPFTAKGRVDDIDAIVSVIDAAKKSVDVAVMDYFPRTLYSKHVK